MLIDPNILIGGIISIIVAIVGSGGFWQYLSSKSSKVLQITVENVKADLKRLKEEEEQKEIQNARRRILRFNDELLNNVDHSKEYFDDVIDDATRYKNYCLEHPGFQNGKAVMAIKNIERVYQMCMEEHKFL
ncbi:MAG: hypothetical protein IKE28_09540 [Solobacterium sp.]|nr:hypothetical protein [Solobacterium sp.]